MRIYLPATSSILRALLAAQGLPGPLTAFAVTPGLRSWYADGDDEELEYAATMEAARASLRLLDSDATAARLRVVLAFDVPTETVEVRDDLDRGVVRLVGGVGLPAVASAHIDTADAAATVGLAAGAIIAADLGDPAAQDSVDDAEGHELSWYATQELDAVLDAM